MTPPTTIYIMATRALPHALTLRVAASPRLVATAPPRRPPASHCLTAAIPSVGTSYITQARDPHCLRPPIYHFNYTSLVVQDLSCVTRPSFQLLGNRNLASCEPLLLYRIVLFVSFVLF